MVTREVWLCVAAMVTLSCGPSSFPPGLLAECQGDVDCLAPFRCLPWPSMLMGRPPHDGGAAGVCSRPCVTRADCPTVSSQHCGEATLCTQGVCDFSPCD